MPRLFKGKRPIRVAIANASQILKPTLANAPILNSSPGTVNRRFVDDTVVVSLQWENACWTHWQNISTLHLMPSSGVFLGRSKHMQLLHQVKYSDFCYGWLNSAAAAFYGQMLHANTINSSGFAAAAPQLQISILEMAEVECNTSLTLIATLMNPDAIGIKLCKLDPYLVKVSGFRSFDWSSMLPGM